MCLRKKEREGAKVISGRQILREGDRGRERKGDATLAILNVVERKIINRCIVRILLKN